MKYKYYIIVLLASIAMLIITVASNAQASKTWLNGQTGQIRWDTTTVVRTPALAYKVDSVTKSNDSLYYWRAGSSTYIGRYTTADSTTYATVYRLDSTRTAVENRRINFDSTALYCSPITTAFSQVYRNSVASAFYVSTKAIQVLFNGIGATADTSSGFKLVNRTPATNGAQQMAPSFTQAGSGYGTTGSAAQPVGYQIDVLPVQGTTPTVNWYLKRVLNGTATTVCTFESGLTTIANHLTVTTNSMYGAAFRSNLASDDNLNHSSTGPQISIANSASKYFSVTKVGTGEVFRADVKGVVLVTMTTTTRDAISSPATGALINNSSTSTTDMYDGTRWCQLGKGLKGSATLDFSSTNAQRASDLTITVTGAADGDVVSLGVPNASIVSNSCFTAWVSATNTVTVRFNNFSSIAQDPASGTFSVFVFKN